MTVVEPVTAGEIWMAPGTESLSTGPSKMIAMGVRTLTPRTSDAGTSLRTPRPRATVLNDHRYGTSLLPSPSAAGPPSYEVTVVPGTMFQSESSDTPEETRARIQQGMLSTLGAHDPGYGYNDPPSGLAPHAVVGWCYDDLMPVRIDGREALGQEGLAGEGAAIWR